MPFRPYTVVERRVRWLFACGWGVLLLAVAIAGLGLINPASWEADSGRSGSGGSVGYCRDGLSSQVVRVDTTLSLGGERWQGVVVRTVAVARFTDVPVGSVPAGAVVLSRDEIHEKARPWFNNLCDKRGQPELKPLYDQAIANGGSANITFPWRYIPAAAKAATSYGFIPWLLALVAMATLHTWRAGEPASGGCIGCGYDLAGIDPAAPCPECGHTRSP